MSDFRETQKKHDTVAFIKGAANTISSLLGNPYLNVDEMKSDCEAQFENINWEPKSILSDKMKSKFYELRQSKMDDSDEWEFDDEDGKAFIVMLSEDKVYHPYIEHQKARFLVLALEHEAEDLCASIEK